jgi:hypothetical protein
MSGPSGWVPFSELVEQYRPEPKARNAQPLVAKVNIALVIVLAVGMVAALSNPCGGGGDLCLGGLLGLMAGGVGLLILIALGIRAVVHRSSPLVLIDVGLGALLAPAAIIPGSELSLALAMVMGIVGLAVVGAILAAREVSPHRLERVVLAVFVVGVAVLFSGQRAGIYGLPVAVIAIVALFWAPSQPPATPSPEPPAAG